MSRGTLPVRRSLTAKFDSERPVTRYLDTSVLDGLSKRQFQVVQDTGFNWPRPEHFRILTLPYADDLDAAISRIGRFLTGYRQ